MGSLFLCHGPVHLLFGDGENLPKAHIELPHSRVGISDRLVNFSIVLFARHSYPDFQQRSSEGGWLPGIVPAMASTPCKGSAVVGLKLAIEHWSHKPEVAGICRPRRCHPQNSSPLVAATLLFHRCNLGRFVSHACIRLYETLRFSASKLCYMILEPIFWLHKKWNPICGP